MRVWITGVALAVGISSAASAAGWTRWAFAERDVLAGDGAVFIYAVEQGASPNRGPSVLLVCMVDGQRIVLRDGRYHSGRIFDPQFKFDDDEGYELAGYASAHNGVTYLWGASGVDEFGDVFADGLRRGSVLRYSLGGPIISASLRGSTAAMAQYDAACSALQAD